MRIYFANYPANTHFSTVRLAGAAITLLDSVYLQLALPTVQISVVGYGMPRVSEQVGTLATSSDSLESSGRKPSMGHIRVRLDPVDYPC